MPVPSFKFSKAEIARLEQGDELSRVVHALLNEWDRRGLHGFSASAATRIGRPWHLLPAVHRVAPDGSVVEHSADRAAPVL